MKISGVYKITNTITGDFYIGSSKDIKHRWHCHKCPSTWNSKPNSLLYNAIQKYGLDNFTFEVLEETDNLKEREQYYIEQLKPSYNSIYANGIDIERQEEWYKARYENHHDEILDTCKEYRNRLCLYKGEILMFGTLRSKFYRDGIPHAALEAKKYLIK